LPTNPQPDSYIESEHRTIGGVDSPRMTLQTQAVLAVLMAAEDEVYGLEIIRTSGLAPGTIYPLLQRLRAARWVVARWESDDDAAAENRPARRYYTLSPQGRARAVHALAAAGTRRSTLARLLALPSPDAVVDRL
jgi:PadR family transcriptional regulator, regulatory protein PadR